MARKPGVCGIGAAGAALCVARRGERVGRGRTRTGRIGLLTAEDHARWNEARGRGADATWWAASGAEDYSSGAGDWAESFAWSQTTEGGWYSKIGPPPDAADLAVMADIIG